MTLTLVIPGLLWPRQVMRDTLYDTDFPALQTLLGKGSRLASTGASADAWWCSHLGIGPAEFVAAPLRLHALGKETGDSTWLCADPVHLQADEHGATLKDPALLPINAEEAAQLHAMLAPLFAEMGELVVTTPSQWHLRLTTPVPALPDRLYDFVEHSAAALLPQGDDGRRWRQLINEVQMSLHAHPINTERDARGQAAINSIALWGGGQMPEPQTNIRGTLFCDDPIVAGAGRLAGLQVEPLPTRLADMATDCIVYWHRLLVPAASHDAQAWREGLQQLNNDWLTPALAALASGKLKRIELHGFGDEDAVSLSMTSIDRYRFWRKPRRLETL
ncbi:MAG: hypothetical protein WAO76_17615 [Georgfuchsia sp.]